MNSYKVNYRMVRTTTASVEAESPAEAIKRFEESIYRHKDDDEEYEFVHLRVVEAENK